MHQNTVKSDPKVKCSKKEAALQHGKTGSYTFRRRVMMHAAKWLYVLTRPTKKNDYEYDHTLHQVLDNWLVSDIEKHDTLVIGIVRCKKCEYKWEALAYKKTVTNLVCPKCNRRHSEVAGA